MSLVLFNSALTELSQTIPESQTSSKEDIEKEEDERVTHASLLTFADEIAKRELMEYPQTSSKEDIEKEEDERVTHASLLTFADEIAKRELMESQENLHRGGVPRIREDVTPCVRINEEGVSSEWTGTHIQLAEDTSSEVVPGGRAGHGLPVGGIFPRGTFWIGRNGIVLGKGNLDRVNYRVTGRSVSDYCSNYEVVETNQRGNKRCLCRCN